jgi:transposase-like protein
MSEQANAPWRDESLLRQKYVDEGLSTRELRDLWGCSRKTVSNWLDKYDIETPENPDNPPWQDKETLERLYIDEQLTCAEIGDRLGCSGHTADKWRQRHGIKPLHKRREWLETQYHDNDLYIKEIAEKCRACRKTVAEWLDKLEVRTEEDRPADYADEKPWQDPEVLRELYHEQELSAKRVADELGCATQTVRHWMIEHDIERRPWYHRTTDTPPSTQRRYPTIEGPHSTVLIHRFVAFATGKMSFEELCDPNIIVHHRTNVGWDNRPENLEVMTRSEHMKIHGRNDYTPETL